MSSRPAAGRGMASSSRSTITTEPSSMYRRRGTPYNRTQRAMIALTKERALMFVRNRWYVAAWGQEIDKGLLQRWLLDEPVLLYRTQDGTPVALGDRCPHRKYPL